MNQQQEIDRLRARVLELEAQLKHTQHTVIPTDNVFLAMLRAMKDVVILLDGQGRYLQIFPEQPQAIYLSNSQIIGKTLFEVLPNDVATHIDKHLKSVLASGKSEKLQYSLNIDSQQYYYSAIISAVGEGEVVLVARNINNLKESERKLTETQNMLNAIFENNHQGYVVLDRYRSIVSFNPVAQTILNTDTDSLAVGLPIDLYTQTWDENIVIAIEKAEKGRTSRIETWHIVNNTKKWFECIVSPHKRTAHKNGGVFITLTEITDKKEILNNLMQSKSNLRQLFESTNFAFFLLDDQLQIEIFNSPAQNNYQSLFKSAIAKKSAFLENITPKYRPIFAESLKKSAQQKHIKQQFEVKTKNGDFVWFELDIHTSHNSLGHNQNYTVSLHDISAQKATEQQLLVQAVQINAQKDELEQQLQKIQDFTQEIQAANEELQSINQVLKETYKQVEISEQQFRSFIDNSTDGLLLTDTEGNLIAWNHAMTKLSGFVPDAVIGQPIWTVLDGMAEKNVIDTQFCEFVSSAIKETLKSGVVRNERVECIAKPADEQYNVEILSFPITTDKGTMFGATARNISSYRSLQSERNFMATVVNATKDLITIKDKELRYLAVNDAFLSFFGLKQSTDVLGKRFEDFNTDTPELEKQVRALELNILEHPEDKHFEMRFERKTPDGATHYMSSQKVPVFDENGNVAAVASLSRDITDLIEADNKIKQQYHQIQQQKRSLEVTNAEMFVVNKTLSENKAQLEAVLNNAPFAIVAINEAHDILNCNHYFAALFSPDVDLQTLKTLYALLPKEKNTEIYQSITEAFAGQLIATENVILQNEDMKQYESHYIPVEYADQEEKVVLLILNDITDRKKNQEELRKNEKRLSELNATKDKFFSIIAHDLKNPFSTVIQISELLLNILHRQDMEKIEKFIRLINNSANTAFALLENLLQWSRAQTGRLRLTPQNIHVETIIDETIDYLHSSASNKNIELFAQVKSAEHCYADINMLTTILRNLVSNALKFTMKGGRVTVTTSDISVAGKAFINFVVEDNGIGISEENKHKLFRIDEAFSMEGTENEQGTGLGLILCKEFVNRNGGELSVESIEGIGSKFSFSLPLHAPSVNINK